jgi:hypothetical protein
MQIQAVSALAEMVCDWSVAILEQAVSGTGHRYLVRRYALGRICELLRRAIRRGYSPISRTEVSHLECQVVHALEGPPTTNKLAGVKIGALDDLCNHLSRAIADGLFEELPDF